LPQQSCAAADPQRLNRGCQDPAGSGTLGENIRLLLLAYGNRRHIQQKLGETFAAKYYTGPLGIDRQMLSASKQPEQTLTPRRGRNSVGLFSSPHPPSAPLSDTPP
jgi:hypothetical protein